MNAGDKKALVIARRSRKNLDFIYAQKGKQADVEEFTQLLNSMLGMLICLREEYFKGSEVTWDDVEKHGLQTISVAEDSANEISPRLRKSETFSKLISNLRHAFSHNCFELVGNPITGIKAWNIQTNQENLPENRVWQTELSEKQLLDIATLFMDYLEKNMGSS